MLVINDRASTLPQHGGDLAWAANAFPGAPLPWIDLSTGINPRGYPVVTEGVEWNTLPSPAALDTLAAAARRYYRAERHPIVPVAGIELAIRLLPLLLDEKVAVNILSPTYSSHADAWRFAGHRVNLVAEEDDLGKDCRVCVVASPNNPDGRVLLGRTLVALAGRMARQDGILVVDRSFADVSSEPDALPLTDGLVELRSFGKFFGLPGLRLGFVIGGGDLAVALARVLGAWPINTIALETGRVALLDEAWQEATRQRLKSAAAELRGLLARHATVRGGTDLFQLIKIEEATQLFGHLASRGVLTRIFDYKPRWLRVGLPANAMAQARLAKALDEFGSRS